MPTSATSKRASQKAAKAAAAISAAAGSLQDAKAATLDGDSTTKRRRHERRCVDEKVARAIATQCKYVPKAVLEHKMVGGMLLRDRLQADIAALDKGQRLGAKYWAATIRDYTADCGTAADLKPEIEGEDVADELLDALAKMHDDNNSLRNNRDFTKYLQTAGPFNQTEWIGVAKIMADPKIERLRSHDECMMEWMKFAARTHAQQTFPAEIAACLPLFDKALTLHWGSLKKSAVKLSTFLELHLDTCALIMDRTDLMAVIASKSSMDKVRSQVARLYDSSSCGKVMFSEHMRAFAAEDYTSRIQQVLDGTFAADEITADALKQCRTDCQRIVFSVAKVKSVHTKRAVNIDFFGSTVTLQVATPEEEVLLRTAAKLKNLSIGAVGGLPLLSYEKWVGYNVDRTGPVIVPDSELVGPAAARRLVAEIIADDRIASFAEVTRTITAQSSSLLCLDRSFRLELAYLSEAASLIGKSIQSAILECLPDFPNTEEAASLQRSSSKLAALKSTEMVTRSCAAAVGQLDSVQLVLSQMMRAVSPELKRDMSPFFQTVLQRCTLFFTHVHQGSTIRGKAAVDQYVEDLRAQFKGKGIVKVVDIEVLRPFWWLLMPDQILLIQDMLQAAIKAATDEGRSSGVASSSAKDLGKPKVGEAVKRKAGSSSLGDQLAKKALLMKVFGK